MVSPFLAAGREVFALDETVHAASNDVPTPNSVWCFWDTVLNMPALVKLHRRSDKHVETFVECMYVCRDGAGSLSNACTYVQYV